MPAFKEIKTVGDSTGSVNNVKFYEKYDWVFNPVDVRAFFFSSKYTNVMIILNYKNVFELNIPIRVIIIIRIFVKKKKKMLKNRYRTRFILIVIL